MTHTRFNIVIIINIVNRALATPVKKHLVATTKVLLYFKETGDRGIIIKKLKSL